MLKTIVSAPEVALASRIAWRKEPGPESFVFVTVKVAARAAVTENRRKQTNPRGARLLMSMKWLGRTSFGTMEDLLVRGRGTGAAGGKPAARARTNGQAYFSRAGRQDSSSSTDLGDGSQGAKKGGPDKLSGPGRKVSRADLPNSLFHGFIPDYVNADDKRFIGFRSPAAGGC